MLVQPESTAVPRTALHRRAIAQSPADARRTALAVEAIGHLVPRRDFAARIDSTFAQACNVAWGGALLTLVTPRVGNGPTSLVLAGAADLRRWFDVGDVLVCRHGIARTARVEIVLAGARIWRPAPRRAGLPPPLLHSRLQRMTAWLERQRRDKRSVIDGAAAATAAALVDACRAGNCVLASQHAMRLVGWGEGLTPAGDDYLIGVCAGLDGARSDDASRAACRTAIGDSMIASLPRTTRLSAHYLRLAAHGHYNERVLAARDALLSETPWSEVDAAWCAACAVGATSGADTLAGLLGALGAWPPDSTAAGVA